MTKRVVRRDFANGGGGQLHYYWCGDRQAGVPLLCLHMSPHSALIYENFVAAMGNQRLTLAVDTPGFGNSDVPLEEPAIADYAAAMGDVLDALKLTKIHVMGYHTGTSIAVELARQRPAQVQRLVLVSAPIWTAAERALVEHRTHPQPISEDGSHLQRYWQEAVSFSMPGRSLEMLGRIFPERLLNPATIHWGHQAASRYSLQTTLVEVNKPILVLNPDDDLTEQTQRAQAYLRHPDSRIHDLPGWGHGFLDVKTDAAAELVNDFLSAH